MKEKEKLLGREGGEGGEGGRKLNDSKYNHVNKITHVTGYEITTLCASKTKTGKLL